MLRILLIIVLLPIGHLMAQTDIIALRSHSGHLNKFTKKSTVRLDGIETNFGMQREPAIKNAALDTVRFISEGVAIMVTSEYCGKWWLAEPLVDEYGCVLREANLGNKWSAGTDTVYNHPLFMQKHSLDSIREILRTTYNFQNSMDSVVFIGYDNAAMEHRKQLEAQEKLIQEGRKAEKSMKGSFGFGLLMSILGPLFVVYLISPLAFKWIKKET